LVERDSMAWTRRGAARALADQKGVTAIEYALIATGATTIVVTCYRVFFDRMAAMLNTVIFPG
jgi:Flp pilus assembly pilin Flp